MKTVRVLLNPRARGGSAAEKWAKIRPLFPNAVVHDLAVEQLVEIPLAPGDRVLCAGGDGTLNVALNHLIARFGVERLKELEIGHVGIGSNNSFLRPYDERTMHKKVPMRAGARADWHDVGLAENPRTGEKRYFIANASIGFLAQANVVFNTDAAVARLKKLGPFVADSLTLVKALRRYEPVPLRISTGEGTMVVDPTNFHIMKHRSYAGGYYFDPAIPESDGAFQLHWLERAPKSEVLRRFVDVAVLGKMARGKTGSSRSAVVEVSSDRAFPIEVDGEILTGDAWVFRCLEKRARVLEWGAPPPFELGAPA